jgi:6-phosphofructokinase 1
MKFPLYGKNGLLEHLREHFKKRHHHAVIAIAEGAGRHLIGDSGEKDASGNVKFNDVGAFLKDEIKKAFTEWGERVEIKYIDPSYVVRSVAANSEDNIFCSNLARYAVDAAMCGKTDMMIGYWHGVFVNVPLKAIQGMKKRVNPDRQLWMGVLAATEQPIDWWD